MHATYPTYFILFVVVTLIILGEDSNYEAPSCVILSILLQHLFQIYTFSSALYSQTPSISACFVVLTAAIIKDGGSKFYQNIDANLQRYTAEHPRRQ
jgi:hypothetical protein